MKWHFLLILGALVSLAGQAFAKERAKVTIPVNVAFASDSLWTKDEILRRFEYTQNVYAHACEKLDVRLELNEMVDLRDPAQQDLVGHLTSASVKQLKEILAQFKKQVRPTLIYLRRGFDEGQKVSTPHQAQAFTFDGPRSLEQFRNYPINDLKMDLGDRFPFITGNLDWERFDELKSIHGVSIIAEGFSEKFKEFNIVRHHSIFTTDSHELGHILLNDGSHRDTEKNIMASDERVRFDEDQCELIANYQEMEVLRESAIRKAMSDMCSFFRGQRSGEKLPTYCF